MSTGKFTIASIQARQRELRKDVERQGEKLKEHFQELFAPAPPPSNKVSALIHHAATAYTILDGAMTGYKLLKVLFPHKRRRRTSR